MQKNDTSSRNQKPNTSSPDKLVDGKKAGIELTEQELDKISGGPGPPGPVVDDKAW